MQLENTIKSIYGEEDGQNLLDNYPEIVEIIKKENISRDELVDRIDKYIYESILTGHKYSENLPFIFKHNHPDLFIDNYTPEQVKRMSNYESFKNTIYQNDDILGLMWIIRGNTPYSYDITKYLENMDINFIFNRMIHTKTNEDIIHIEKDKNKEYDEAKKAEIFNTLWSYSILGPYYSINIQEAFKNYDKQKSITLDDALQLIDNYIYSIRNQLTNDVIYNPFVLPKHFDKTYPELHIHDRNVPNEITEILFRGKSVDNYGQLCISALRHLKRKNPEYKKYLSYINLDELIFSNPWNHEIVQTILNLYGKEEGIEFIIREFPYHHDFSKVRIEENITKEKLNELIDIEMDNEYYNIITKQQVINTNHYPYKVTYSERFKKAHPELFLEKDAPEELQEIYYHEGLGFDVLKTKPEYVKHLQNLDILCLCRSPRDYILIKTIKELYGNSGVLNFILDYDLMNKLIQDNVIDKLKFHGKWFHEYEPTDYNEFLALIDYFILNEVMNYPIYEARLPEGSKNRHPEMFSNTNHFTR